MQREVPAVLIPEAAIQARVQALAREISADYRDARAEEVVLVGVLRGAFIFLADLARRLTVPRRVDFLMCSTYGAATEAGAVNLLMDLRSDVRGAHVLIVEDIVDTGRTLRYLLDVLAARGPASLKTCAFVRKPDRVKVPVSIDYLGFDIPDVWAVGYGLDCGDCHRTLPYLGAVETH
jgi:hypoxanthine phosphoribosyltransferase